VLDLNGKVEAHKAAASQYIHIVSYNRYGVCRCSWVGLVSFQEFRVGPVVENGNLRVCSVTASKSS
jgi:hypothetical protein